MEPIKNEKPKMCIMYVMHWKITSVNMILLCRVTFFYDDTRSIKSHSLYIKHFGSEEHVFLHFCSVIHPRIHPVFIFFCYMAGILNSYWPFVTFSGLAFKSCWNKVITSGKLRTLFKPSFPVRGLCLLGKKSWNHILVKN